MDHQQAAVAVVRLVEAVGVAGVDRKIVIGIGIHQLGRHRVEPLRSLTVALIQLRPKIARPPADRIDLQELETAGGVLLPDFELRLFLENAHKDRRMLWHLPLPQQREQLGRQLLCRLGRQRLCRLGRRLRCCLGRRRIAAFAKARDRRQCRGKSRRQHKRTDHRGADHCHTPDLEPVLSECVQSVAFLGQTRLGGSGVTTCKMPGRDVPRTPTLR